MGRNNLQNPGYSVRVIHLRYALIPNGRSQEVSKLIFLWHRGSGDQGQPSFSTCKPSLAHSFISICPGDQFSQQKTSRSTTGKDRYTIHEEGVLYNNHSLPQTLSHHQRWLKALQKETPTCIIKSHILKDCSGTETFGRSGFNFGKGSSSLN